MSGGVGGAVHSIILRDAWGKQVHKAGTPTTAYLYTGQRWDELLGLYDYNARWYDPGTGRFVSADTIVSAGDEIRISALLVACSDTELLTTYNKETRDLTELGSYRNWSKKEREEFGFISGPFSPDLLNRLAYVHNAPINKIDPSGHVAIVDDVAIALIALTTMALILILGWVWFLNTPLGEAWLEFTAEGLTEVVIWGTTYVKSTATGPWEEVAVLSAQTQSKPDNDSEGGGASSDNPVWDDLQPWRGPTKTNGLTGKKKRYYQWDYTHGDVEVYDSNGNHLGSMDPATGEMTKPAKPGRRINLR